MSQLLPTKGYAATSLGVPLAPFTFKRRDVRPNDVAIGIVLRSGIPTSVSASLDWDRYVSLLEVDGTMVVVGIPDTPVPINAFGLVAGRRSLAGSKIGGTAETQEMLDFCPRYHERYRNRAHAERRCRIRTRG